MAHRSRSRHRPRGGVAAAVTSLLAMTLAVATGSGFASGSILERELASSSASGSSDASALPSSTSDFVFDGTTSDIARQLYLRHTAGDVLASVTPNSIPTAVTQRLEAINVSYSDLPGLLQRAVLWDSGYVISPLNDAVRVQTMGGRSMAQLAVAKVEYDATGCTAYNCSQPHNGSYFDNEFCTGTQMLGVAKCMVDEFEDDSSAHLAMWSTGGDPDAVPEIRLIKHGWLDSSTNDSYVVYAVHTMSEDDEPAYGECDVGGYGSLVLPCYGMDTISVSVAAVMSPPVETPWVTTWLKQYQPANDTSVNEEGDVGSVDFNLLLLIPIILAALMVLALIIFLAYRRWRRNSNSAWQQDASVLHVSEFVTPEMKSKPAMSDDEDTSEAVHPNDLSHRRTALGTIAEVTNNRRPSAPPPVAILEEPGSLPAYRDTFYSRQSTTATDSVLQTLCEDPNLSGKRIPYDHIQVDRTVSRGAYGEVWVCKCGGQQVAVKRLLQSQQPTFTQTQEFTHEIQLTASLDHPNIVGFLGVSWNSLSNLLMVMEYVPRGDLQKYLKQHGDLLSWARDKIYIALGIAQALKYLHARSIIHRDIKARNVLLTKKLEPKLIDFGVSRKRPDRTMTAGVGTPFWTAPEVLEGTDYSEKADIYSFGVLLSELDTCESPYYDEVGSDGEQLKPFQILKRVIGGSLSPSFTDGCPKRVRRAADRCLQRDAELRPTAAELIELLEG